MNIKTDDEKMLLIGRITSMASSILTALTFGFALIAVPISGANAPNGGIVYPYLDVVAQYPRDFLWQYLALFQVLAYLINYVVLKELTAERVKIFAKIGTTLAALSSLTLLITYYTQVNVVPVSLMAEEIQGLPLIIQYNSHGLFIAMEELGYILMVLSFAALIPVFAEKSGKISIIRTIYAASILTAISSYIFIALKYGLDKQDRFEIIIISINWITIIINGLLTASVFKRLRRS